MTAVFLDFATVGRDGLDATALRAAAPGLVLHDDTMPDEVAARIAGHEVVLLNKVRMVWIPVAFINPQSKPQGALLITAADPLATMSEHETSLLAGQGGLAIPERTAADLAAAIDTNTDLLGRMGADSVPFMLSRNAEGMVQTHAGAMETAALAAWLGVQP